MLRAAAAALAYHLADFTAELEGKLAIAEGTARGPAVLTTTSTRGNPTEAAVLRVCSRDVPVKGLVIARRLGREYDAYLRRTLAGMVRRGVLRRATSGAGYLLDEPTPPAAPRS